MANFNSRSLLSNPAAAIYGGGNNGLFYAIDGNTEKWAACFIAPTDDTVTHVAARISGVAGTPVAYNVRVETVSAGDPTGTLAWTNSSGQLASGAGAGWTDVALTASGSITRGTAYGIVYAPATDPAGANYIQMQENSCLSSSAPSCNTVNWARRHNGSAYVNASGFPQFLVTCQSGVKFGSFMHAFYGSGPTLSNTAWKGMRLVIQVSGWYWGCIFGRLANGTSGTATAFIIDSGNNILRSATQGPSLLNFSAWPRGPSPAYYFNPIKLTRGTVVRVVEKDTAGSLRHDVPQCDSAHKTLKPLEQYGYYTEGTSSDGDASPTSWSDTDTAENAYFQLYGSESLPAGGGSRSIRLGMPF